MYHLGDRVANDGKMRRPQRIGRIVLLNTAGFLMPPTKRLPLRLRLIRDLGPPAALLVRGFNAFSLGATYLASRKGLPRQVRRAYRAPYNNWANRIATLRFVQDIPLGAGDPSYEQARWVDQRLHLLRQVPALICWGERDFVFDEHFLAEWRRRLPQAEVHTFPDAGHYCLEDAGDRIIPLLRDFLQRHRLTDRPPIPSEAAR